MKHRNCNTETDCEYSAFEKQLNDHFEIARLNEFQIQTEQGKITGASSISGIVYNSEEVLMQLYHSISKVVNKFKESKIVSVTC